MEIVRKSLAEKNKTILRKKGVGDPNALEYIEGCPNCPWRNDCHAYNPENTKGCSARKHMIKQMRLDLSGVKSVNANLKDRALILRESVEAYRSRITNSGEEPLRDKAFVKAFELDLELAKMLFKQANPSKQHIHVTRDEDIIDINPSNYKVTKKEEEAKE